MTRKAFAVGMFKVSESLQLEPPEKKVLDAYYEELKPIPNRAFETGVARLLRNYPYKTWPNPAHFVFYSCTKDPAAGVWAGGAASEFSARMDAERTFLRYKRHYDRLGLPRAKEAEKLPPGAMGRERFHELVEAIVTGKAVEQKKEPEKPKSEIERLRQQVEDQAVLIFQLRQQVEAMQKRTETETERKALLQRQARQLAEQAVTPDPDESRSEDAN